MTKVVMAFLLSAELGLASLLSCHPQNSTRTSVGQTAVLKTVMTKKAFTSMCKHDTNAPIKTDQLMQTDCNAFCKVVNGGISVPLLLGAEGFGFNHAEMDGLCHGTSGNSPEDLITNDPPALAQCRLWSQAVPEIKLSSQSFQIEKKKFENQQSVFRSQVAKERRVLQIILASKAFRDGFDAAIDKPGYIYNQMVSFKAKTKGSVPLKEAMEKLVAKGTDLNDVVTANLAKFKSYLKKCNRLLLTKGSLNEYILDICARGNQACIENPQADRVGCCCGVNPLALGSGNFDVEGFKKFANLGRASRRLSSSSDSDTCAEIKRQTRADTKTGFDEVKSNGDEKMWDKMVEKSEKKYPVYAQKCTLNEHHRRRGVPRRQLASDASDQDENHNETVASVQSDNASRMSHAKMLKKSDMSRKLQDNSCAKPPAEPNGHKSVFVAVPKNAMGLDLLLRRRTVNGVQGALNDDAKLLQICENFCEGGIPFLIGAKDMGLNLSGANRICLPPVDKSRSALLQYDKDTLQQCKSWAIDFNKVTWESASFQKEEQVFDAVKLQFETMVQTSVKDLQTYMLSQKFEDVMDAAGRSSKMKEFEKTLKNKLAPVKDSSALTQQAAKLEIAADKLKTAVVNAQVALRNFLAECDDLYLGTGSQGEYLLDFGATSGQYCIDNDQEASHAACCCGFNPVSLLGQLSINAPISGLQAEAGAPYAAGETIGQHYQISLRRKLQAKVDEKDGVDFCAQSWTDNMNAVGDIYKNILKIGDGSNILSVDKRKRDRYNKGGNKDYCSPLECAQSTCLKEDVNKFVNRATATSKKGITTKKGGTTKKGATTKEGATTKRGDTTKRGALTKEEATTKKGTATKKGASAQQGASMQGASLTSSLSHKPMISPMISAISTSLMLLLQIV